MICRSWSTSNRLSVAQWYIDGSTSVSRRTSCSAASRRSNSSGTVSASAAASSWSDRPSIVAVNSSSGCAKRRSSIHASRWSDPADRLGWDRVVEQPTAGVHRRLAAPEDREAVGVGDRGERVHRDEPCVVVHREPRGVRRRHRSLEVRRVDEPAPHADSGCLVGGDVAQGVAVGAVQEVLAPAEEAHPTGVEQLVERRSEVRTQLLGGRPLVETGVGSFGVDRVGAQREGVHPVERGGLVQLHERVGVVPVAAGLVTTVDEHDVSVRRVHQLVGERESGGSCADDQVVGVEVGHDPASRPPYGRRPSGSTSDRFARQ